MVERDRGMRGQQFQHSQPLGCEPSGRQVVFQIECADQLGLFNEWQAEHRPWTLLEQIRILRKEALTRGVFQDDTLLSTDHVAKKRLGQLSRRCRRLAQLNFGSLAAGPGFSLDSMFLASLQNQEAS